MVDLDTGSPHDVELVGDHQVVDLVDRACRTVFDRQHPVIAEPLLHSIEHALEIGHIENGGGGKELFAGDGGIGSLHALAGDARHLGKELRRVIECPADLFIGSYVPSVQLVLIGTAELEDQGVEDTVIVLQVLAALHGDLCQLFTLPFGIEYGQPVLLFICGDRSGYVHPVLDGLDDPLIRRVDLFSQL